MRQQPTVTKPHRLGLVSGSHRDWVTGYRHLSTPQHGTTLRSSQNRYHSTFAQAAPWTNAHAHGTGQHAARGVPPEQTAVPTDRLPPGIPARRVSAGGRVHPRPIANLP